MKENPISNVGAALKIVDVVLGPVLNFAEKVVSDDPKPVQRSEKSLEDLLTIAALRSELESLTSERDPQIGQTIHEPTSPLVMPTAI